MKITEIKQYDDRLAAAFGRLIPQLSQTAKAPSRAHLERIISAPDTHLLIAEEEDSGAIIGVLTLVIYDIPTTRRGWIEDVIVDASQRGRHIGLALVEKAIETAKECGVSQINLTSNPRRTAARNLYRRCGFTEVDTTLFRLTQLT